MSDFGPKITIKIVESLRDDIYAGRLKSGSEIKVICAGLSQRISYTPSTAASKSGVERFDCSCLMFCMNMLTYGQKNDGFCMVDLNYSNE